MLHPLHTWKKISFESKIHILINIDSNTTNTKKIMLIEFNAHCIHIPMSSMHIEKQSINNITEAITDLDLEMILE